MAVEMTQGKKPGTPTTPDPKQLAKLDKQIKEHTDSIQQNIQNMDKALGELDKSAGLVCLLRLDMVADKLDKFDSRLASQVDALANSFEKEVFSI